MNTNRLVNATSVQQTAVSKKHCVNFETREPNSEPLSGTLVVFELRKLDARCILIKTNENY